MNPACALCGKPTGSNPDKCTRCWMRANAHPLDLEADRLAMIAATANRAAELDAERLRIARLRALGRTVRVALVGCGKTKRDVPSPARLLYLGRLFQLSFEYATRQADEVWIVSGAHGLVHPDRILEPYDQRLPTSVSGKESWGRSVRQELGQVYSGVPVEYLVLAGADYADVIRHGGSYNHTAPDFVEPLRGLQVGERLRWLNLALAAGSTARSTGDSRSNG